VFRARHVFCVRDGARRSPLSCSGRVLACLCELGCKEARFRAYVQVNKHQIYTEKNPPYIVMMIIRLTYV